MLFLAVGSSNVVAAVIRSIDRSGSMRRSSRLPPVSPIANDVHLFERLVRRRQSINRPANQGRTTFHPPPPPPTRLFHIESAGTFFHMQFPSNFIVSWLEVFLFLLVAQRGGGGSFAVGKEPVDATEQPKVRGQLAKVPQLLLTVGRSVGTTAAASGTSSWVQCKHSAACCCCCYEQWLNEIARKARECAGDGFASRVE